MKKRKHHNNYGKQTIKKDKCRKQLKYIARMLKLPFEKERTQND